MCPLEMLKGFLLRRLSLIIAMDTVSLFSDLMNRSAKIQKNC